MSSKDRPRAAVPDEVKERFRAALEKKQAHAGTDVSDTTDHGKVEHAHGPETSARQQMFRRKSGG
ncbi:MAG: DUF5302 domain-containing protein [Micrococcales bacterium]|nr:DUF5302 domain-containing protein [Micrococcales bacterium]